MTKDPDLAAWERQMAIFPASPPDHTSASRADRVRARLVPLRERLRDALAALPAAELAEGIRLEQVWPLCRGRQRSKPRAFEVADALRELGWIRVRFYSDGTEPSGTWWFPPGVVTSDAKAKLRARKDQR